MNKTRFHSFLLQLLITTCYYSIKPVITDSNNKLNSAPLAFMQPSTYRLIGSLKSYAQYNPWRPGLNGSISFEFKTHQPNGLLLYAQNPPYKYIQVSLNDGTVRLRMRIGEKDNPSGIFLISTLPSGSAYLNDEKWHSVTISRQRERTILKVDDEITYHIHKDANLNAADLYFGDYPVFKLASHAEQQQTYQNNRNNLLVFGGIPLNIETFDLSLSTALFEPRFNGFFRNVRSLNCDLPFMRRLNVIGSENLRYVAERDACMLSPCQNNGVCKVVDTNLNFECDCSYTTYEGDHCERPRPPPSSSQLTFMGKDYFKFEMPTSDPFATTYEEKFHLEFKTSRSTGLLAYAGDQMDYLVIGLQDGGLFFKLNLKGQIFENTLTIPGTFLHNNHWHSVTFSRKIKQIEVIVDNMKRDTMTIDGDFISMTTRAIYIGGAPMQNTIYRTIRKNFIGCLKNVIYFSKFFTLSFWLMIEKEKFYNE
jgi:hypothetical protein